MLEFSMDNMVKLSLGFFFKKKSYISYAYKDKYKHICLYWWYWLKHMILYIRIFILEFLKKSYVSYTHRQTQTYMFILIISV